MSIQLKPFIDSMQFLSYFSDFFYRSRKKILKFMWNNRRSQVAKGMLKKNAGGITPPNCRLYYVVLVTKTLGNWRKNRQTDKWTRTPK